MNSLERSQQLQLEAFRSLRVLNSMSDRLGYGFSTSAFGNMSTTWGRHQEGGEERVWENRRRFAEAAGFDLENSVIMVPEHGNKVLLVGSEDVLIDIEKADALITTEKGVALILNPADCAPIIISNKEGDFVAMVHAGRAGTNLRIVTKVVEKLEMMGFSDRSEFVVGIGPAVQCSDLSYLETDNPEEWLPHVYVDFEKAENGLEFVVEEINIPGKPQFRISLNQAQEKFGVDFVAYNAAQLEALGIPKENIEISGLCTVCNGKNGLTYSHGLSREDENKYPESRFMAFAVLKHKMP